MKREFEEDTSVMVAVPDNISKSAFNPLFYNEQGILLDDVEMLEKIEEKPYPNEHTCRLKNPKDFDSFARKKCAQKHDEKCIDIIYGIKNNKLEIQALRYPKSIWKKTDAKNHCGERGGKFEPARETSSDTNAVKFSIFERWENDISISNEKNSINLDKVLKLFDEEIKKDENDLQMKQIYAWLSELKDFKNKEFSSPIEGKAGAVLSTKNKNKLISAQKAIQEVLKDAGIDEAEVTSSVQDNNKAISKINPNEPKEEDVFGVILQKQQTHNSISSQTKEINKLIVAMKNITELIKMIGGN